jgi:hypothetical protein
MRVFGGVVVLKPVLVASQLLGDYEGVIEALGNVSDGAAVSEAVRGE